ncbi:MAG: GNAT family N-acetyltransferase [Oscillospiraceae bacterium]|nr:GNAT family N-acetyltransferase [Oscillospiraceae bacterium]
MTIRKTTLADLDTVCRIYDEGRAIMRRSGNQDQWGNNHPPRTLIEQDIQAGKSYVCVSEDEILCVFYFNIERDPTYAKIDGAWLNDNPYGVVHRIARSFQAKGAGAFCLEWCFKQCGNLRLDTHTNNAPMRQLLDKLGFTYCGIIWIENGDERLAFQKTVD